MSWNKCNQKCLSRHHPALKHWPVYFKAFPKNVLCRVWQPKQTRTNQRQGTDWTSADLFCFSVCSSSQVLVRRIEGRVRKQDIGWSNLISKQDKASGTDKANLLQLAKHGKRLTKQFGHAVDHALRRAGLWASTASSTSGPTTRTACVTVQNRGDASIFFIHTLGFTNKLLCQLEVGFAEFFLIPFFFKSAWKKFILQQERCNWDPDSFNPPKVRCFWSPWQVFLSIWEKIMSYIN